MAELTPKQKQAVGKWAGEGATLNEIQSRLKSEFGLSMTYMDARLLMMELEVRIQDRAKPAEPAAAAETSAAGPAEAFADTEPEALPLSGDFAGETPAADAASFTMEADEIMVPGTLVSGSATFSDGVTAKWFLDQMGRLSLKADQPGYQPPPPDVPKFQQGLEKILIKMGLY